MDADQSGKQKPESPKPGAQKPAAQGAPPPAAGAAPKVPPKLKVPKPAAKPAVQPAVKAAAKPAAKPAARKPAVPAGAVPPAAKPAPAPVPAARRAPPTEMVQPLHKSETTRIDLAEAMTQDETKGATAPIEIPLDAEARAKASTSPIDLSGVDVDMKATTAPIRLPGMDADMKATTAPIKLSGVDVDMKATTAPINLSGVDVDMKATTAPINLSGVDVDTKASTARIDQAAGPGERIKTETARIDLPEGAPPKAPKIPVIRGITEGPIEDLEEIMKKSTVRIDAALDESEKLTPDDVAEATKKATVRVQIDDEKKGDTERVDAQAILDAEKAESAKRKTSRIDLGEVLEGEEEQDIFKRRTAVLDSSKLPTGAPAAPRTIRIKRPGAPTPTAVLPSETAHIAAPVTTPVAEPPDSRKSETARIELPPEAAGEKPTARRKTIRIKRPDGTISSRQVTIARAGETAEMEGAVEIEEGAPVEEEAGAVFSIVALVAVLAGIGLVVVNVLALKSLSGF
ncbi:MAG: hypothetical protein JXB04_04110 [Kiritimatiellae bacterium]|nr:hypothetical protein [Kiritimatiellia bacterium]